MIKLTTNTIIFLLVPCILFAQHYSTDQEISTISRDIVEDLKYKGFDEEVVVLDFTNSAGQPTELGAYLASKVTEDLIDARSRFKVVDRSAIQGGKGIDWGRIIDGIGRESEKWLEEDGETIRTLTDATQSLFNPGSNDRRLRGIEAILRGKITPMGDHYELKLWVSERKKGAVLASASGPISNTPSLSRLNGSILQEPSSTDVANGNITSRGGNNKAHRVNRQHFVFELVKCFESGGVIEVHLRLTSQDQESDVEIRSNWVKIFNQKNGSEYNPIRVNIADQTAQWGAKKQLQEDSPVLSIISFKPPEDIEMISKLSIGVYSSQIQSFTIEMEDIFVN